MSKLLSLYSVSHAPWFVLYRSGKTELEAAAAASVECKVCCKRYAYNPVCAEVAL